MAGFKSIVGYDKTVAQLRSAIKHEKVSHAYIIEGPKGAGKTMLAHAFAQTLECETGGEEACGVCRFCKQIESGTHPDVKTLTATKTKNISVNDVREQLVADMAVKPYNEKKKVYIIPNAQDLNSQAQNALLKTIEEPPEYGVILFLTENANALLPTIRSRCVQITLRPLSDELVRDYLVNAKGLSAAKANLCVAFAQGVLGKALLLAESEDFINIKEDAISLLRRMDSIETYEMTAAIKDIKAYHMPTEEYLDLLCVWFRDLLLFKATQDANRLIFKEEVMEIKRQSQRCAYEGIENILQALSKAKTRLKANVNFDLTMELLLEEIKENMQ